MCDACASSDLQSRPNRRAKIWEIDSQWLCTIIGSCLSFREVRQVAAKFRLQFPTPTPSDYQLHTAVIHLASNDRKAGKVLTKMLDRHHAAAIAQLSRVCDEAALTARWEEALSRGDAAPFCWAVMSHPAVTSTLQQRVFSDLHMLSHQIGASARADLRRLHELEEECDGLNAKIQRQQDRLRDELTRRDAELRDLRQLLEEQVAENRRLAYFHRAAGELDRLRTQAADHETRLARAEQDRREWEGESRQLNTALADRDRQIADLLSAAAELQEENALLETRLLLENDQLACEQGCDEPCGTLDLCGRCILFVGGRHQHLPHFRRVVEQAGGVFAHHDGGMDESLERLRGLAGRADAIVFPVDCVSHKAQAEVKHLCRRWDKPLLPLRRSGLGSFIRALQKIAHPPRPQSTAH